MECVNTDHFHVYVHAIIFDSSHANTASEKKKKISISNADVDKNGNC